MKIFKCTPFILFKYDIKFIVFCFPFLLETEFHIVFFFSEYLYSFSRLPELQCTLMDQDLFPFK